jgi:dTDP-4-dehydrorhamnose reductase
MSTVAGCERVDPLAQNQFSVKITFMKKTILIFGVSSFIGSNLVELLKDEFRIIGTYHDTPVSIPGVTCIPCDVLRKEYVTSIVARFRPDLTIYAVGLSSLKGCQLHPKQADALNSAGAVNCCTASERIGSKFVFLSSGFVLGGVDTVYREGETPFPNTTYGSSLSSTEFYVQRSCLNYLILRCAPLYGRSYNPEHNNWFENLQLSFAKGEPVYVDDSVHTGFLDIHIMIRILKLTLAKDVTNRLFHVSSKDFMTRYEFARMYAKIFRKDEGLIQKTTGRFPVDKHKDDNNSYYYRLDTSNIEEFLNTKMPKVEDSLHLTYKRLSAAGLT